VLSVPEVRNHDLQNGPKKEQNCSLVKSKFAPLPVDQYLDMIGSWYLVWAWLVLLGLIINETWHPKMVVRPNIEQNCSLKCWALGPCKSTSEGEYRSSKSTNGLTMNNQGLLKLYLDILFVLCTFFRGGNYCDNKMVAKM
jgi:hypothetical protein